MEESVLQKLCSKAKLDRDKGFQDLQEYLKSLNEDGVRAFEEKFSAILSDSSSEWECKHGALMGSKAVCQTQLCSDDFTNYLLEQALMLADDSEFRVRIAAAISSHDALSSIQSQKLGMQLHQGYRMCSGRLTHREVIGILCKKEGPQVYERCKSTILEGISSNLERDMLTDGAFSDQEQSEKLIEKLSSSPRGEKRNSVEAAQIFHDTAGWKSLETWMKCLQSVIEGCGHEFNEYVDQDLLDLIFRALTHTNRFVRETGYYVCSSLVCCGLVRDGSNAMLLDEDNAILKYGQQFADYLARGMADNWSQVRLASSVATRNFLQSLPSEGARKQFYPVLIPRMCLNRYYVAEGVRIYSQETWKQVTGERGKQLVEMYIDNVVDYYIVATDADNHAVREAACACIAELGAKVGKEVVHTYIPKLLEALLKCFNDDSWPVRDAACVACGNFVLCFPEDSRSTLPALYPLFFNNLQDNIPSVRQGAALALSNVVRAYGEECFDEITKKVKEGLIGVKDQPENTEKYSSLEKGPATYGVVKKLRDNDMELHTDRQMYSCGSLAPKMGRGREGGCMDHKFRKEPEPWELADGCINVVAELSNMEKFAAKVSELLPLVSKAATYAHYTHHAYMKETLCTRLPQIAKGLGKRYFKPHLESFFDIIFYSVTCDNALTAVAANNCLAELSKFLGPSILRGRVEQFNPRYVELLDSVHGPSPFGSGHMGPAPLPGDLLSHPPIGPGLPGPIGQAGLVHGGHISPTGHMPFGTHKGLVGTSPFGTTDSRPPFVGSKPPS